MSGIIKNAFKLSLLKSAGNILKPVTLQQSSRSVWHMSTRFNDSNKLQNLNLSNQLCSCGLHTKGNVCLASAAGQADPKQVTQGEKELFEFLHEEIAAEKQLQKSSNIPSDIDGFKVNLDGSEVSLVKDLGSEVVEVSFNVNHTVDTDVEPEVDPSMDKPELGEMKSRPSFEVEIRRGGKTLGFTCSIVQPSGEQTDDGYNDLFAIDEVVMYEGEWKDNYYSASGDVLDGTLYDLLMNLLEDKGISNEFVDKLTNFSTAYEHSRYIDMLEKIQKFCGGKK